MIATIPVFGDTAAELDLVGHKEGAADESELIQQVDVAEELDLEPSEAPSADCPRPVTRVRPTTPVKVPPRALTAHRRSGSSDKPPVIYYTPQVRSTPARVKAQPTSLPVQVIYKNAPPGGLTPEEKDIVPKAQQEIQEINKQLGLNDHAIGRKEAVLESTRWNIEQVKLDDAQKSSKLQELHQTIMNSGIGRKTSHPLYSDYLAALKKCNDLENEIERLGNTAERLNSELKSLRERARTTESPSRCPCVRN